MYSFRNRFALQHYVKYAVKKYKHLQNLKIPYTSQHERRNINIFIGLD